MIEAVKRCERPTASNHPLLHGGQHSMADLNSTPSVRAGLCGCGCGQDTGVWTRTRPSLGYVAGDHRRYVIGHSRRFRLGPRLPVTKTYRMAGSRCSGRKRLHIIRAERALGKPLPSGSIVHHADGTKSDDSPLVICQGQKYHLLLHARMRVVAAGGDPNTDAVCSRCREVKRREVFPKSARGPLGVNLLCKRCVAEMRPPWLRSLRRYQRINDAHAWKASP